MLNPYENKSDYARPRGKGLTSSIQGAFSQWLQEKYGFVLPDPGNRRFNKEKERKRLGALRDQIIAERMAQKNRLYGGA